MATKNLSLADDLAPVLVAVFDCADPDALHRLNVAVVEQIRALRKQTARAAVATISVGDRVRLKGLRPATLNGREGEVVSLPKSSRSTRITVLLDGDFSPARVPASCLDLVGA